MALNQRDAELAKKNRKAAKAQIRRNSPYHEDTKGYKGIRDSVYGLWRILCTVMNICGFHDFQELCRYQSNLEVPRVSLWHDREWTIFAFERDPIHSFLKTLTDRWQINIIFAVGGIESSAWIQARKDFLWQKQRELQDLQRQWLEEEIEVLLAIRRLPWQWQWMEEPCVAPGIVSFFPAACVAFVAWWSMSTNEREQMAMLPWCALMINTWLGLHRVECQVRAKRGETGIMSQARRDLNASWIDFGPTGSMTCQMESWSILKRFKLTKSSRRKCHLLAKAGAMKASMGRYTEELKRQMKDWAFSFGATCCWTGRPKERSLLTFVVADVAVKGSFLCSCACLACILYGCVGLCFDSKNKLTFVSAGAWLHRFRSWALEGLVSFRVRTCQEYDKTHGNVYDARMPSLWSQVGLAGLSENLQGGVAKGELHRGQKSQNILVRSHLILINYARIFTANTS